MRSLIIRTWLGLAFAAAFAFGVQAGQPYSDKAFRDAQTAGKTILIDVSAPWCPVCRRQQPIIQSIEQERPGLTVLKVDFDSAKGVLRALKVQSQSTLIVFKGKQEVGRSTGDTDAASIRALVAKGF